MTRILLALILTLIIECAVVLAIYRDKKTTYHVFLANILTNPAMNIILILVTIFANYLYSTFLIIFEIIVLFVEYRVYRYIGHEKKKSLILAILLNVISFGIGLLILPVFSNFPIL